MLDWGIGLAVGAVAAVVSEVALLTAIIMPRFPIEKGRTWRGTFYGVTLISAVIGGAAGYIASQFGGFGGGGANSQNAARATHTDRPAAPTKPAKQDTAPQKPDTYLASVADLYFLRDEKTKLVANFSCEIVLYRFKDRKWNFEIKKVTGTKLEDFLAQAAAFLEHAEKDIPVEEKSMRRLRVFLDPFPGEGTYDKVKQAAEQRGWKVDRKDSPWQAELPSS